MLNTTLGQALFQALEIPRVERSGERDIFTILSESAKVHLHSMKSLPYKNRLKLTGKKMAKDFLAPKYDRYPLS